MDEKIVEISEKNFDKSDMFAIFIQGSSGYTQVNDWPSASYNFNSDKSYCNYVQDDTEKLKIITYDSTTNKVKVKTTSAVVCYLYFDKKVDLIVNVNDENNKSGYKENITCNNGSSPLWSEKYDRLEFSNLNSPTPENCTLSYIKDNNSYSTLKSVVEANATNIVKMIEPDYSLATPLTQSEYKVTTNTSSKFSFSGTRWSTKAGDLTKGSTYSFQFNPASNGYYKICYTITKASAGDTLTVVSGGKEKVSVKADLISDTDGCTNIGYLSTSDYILVKHYIGSALFSTKSSASFDLEKTNSNGQQEDLAGYRYTGTNPNNYVWFNNEMWRIIGSVPTCVTASCGSNTTKLVKIIRNQPIGTLAFDANSSTSVWGNNTLYNLLNTNYYATSKNNLNGQENTGCSLYANSVSGVCDYTNIGILSTSKYGKMVKNVYWNTGPISTQPSAVDAYESEKTVQNVQGHVGLMSASDYGFAGNVENHNTSLTNYTTSSETNTNWLHSQAEEWINARGDSYGTSYVTTHAMRIAPSSGINVEEVKLGNSVRPVLYLTEDILVIRGTGTAKDPYIIRQ